MSGDEKKSGNRSHGWDDAGAEFYQESYPGTAIEADFQQEVRRDPSKIATLLPSKRPRVATVTAKRIKRESQILRTYTRKTCTRQDSIHQHTGDRRLSANFQDTLVAMLPDLSENLSNEERTWEDIMLIKSMPISMHQKKQIKIELQSATKLRMQGFHHFMWKRRKVWQLIKIKLKQISSNFELWGTSLKIISGNFGKGTLAFFLMIKWILFLNALVFLIIGTFLVLPTILLEAPTKVCAGNVTRDVYCCSDLYRNKSRRNRTATNFFQNSQFLEYSLLFYGAYPLGTFEADSFRYNFSIAYSGVMLIVFAVSFLTVIKSACKEFRRAIVEREGQVHQYCIVVFAGWDFCINTEKASSTRQRTLLSEMKSLMASKRIEEDKQSRTKQQKFKLLFVRIFVNTLVLLILFCCVIFVRYVIKISFDAVSSDSTLELENFNVITTDIIHQIVFKFLPYIVIVFLNMSVPMIFGYLVMLESYNYSTFSMQLTLIRTILLRVTSLIVLLVSFYFKVAERAEEDTCASATRPLCWETFVGQQFLMLYVTDIVSQFFVTFFINFPRSLMRRHTTNKFLKCVGTQDFDLFVHVLDVAYLQTICWLGMFFSPILPLVAVVGSFILFYVKKFTCTVNCAPTTRFYRVSKSRSFFMYILLLSFIFLVIIPIGFSVVKISPSRACGPLKHLESSWTLVTAAFSDLPTWLQDFVSFFITGYVVVPTTTIFLFTLYYYHAVSSANRHIVKVLKNQLVLEGHDKQFLLNRLGAFIQQHQEEIKHQVQDQR